MCLFMWLVVSVYWIKLFVLIEKKFIFLVNKFVIIVEEGIFIIIFILMFFEICMFFCWSLVFFFKRIVFVWWNLLIVVIIGNIIFRLLYMFVCRSVWSCVWNMFCIFRYKWMVWNFKNGFIFFGKFK